jgi:hypothetical protein
MISSTYRRREQARADARAESSWAKSASIRAAQLSHQLKLARLGLAGPHADVHALARELEVARRTVDHARRVAAAARRVSAQLG